MQHVVFLYPGQGSQLAGMGTELYQAYPQARELFDQADQVLGFSLSRLCFDGPEERLNEDLNAQLAVYTVSCVLTSLLKDHGVVPDMASGYSSGFYAAAYGAGCFAFIDGLHLVRRAGEILLEEGKKIDGAMALIFGLSKEEVEGLCRQVGNVEPAIMNTPRQIVISGLASFVGKAMELAKEKGALDAYPLSVATAYHSRFMEKSSIRLLKEIKDGRWKDPKMPLISYLYLKPVDKNELGKVMAAQLSRSVLWVDLIRKLRNSAARLFIEVGPGSVISRTVRWIDRDIDILAASDKESLQKAVERCKTL
jgi:[acyl-carrier-protein] S-malonyltransferase